MSVTLILTRKPLKAFNRGRQSGRWGELIAVKGPKINAVRLSPFGTPTSVFDLPQTIAQNTAGILGTIGGLSNGATRFIPISTGLLQFSATGEPVSVVKRYTSMERFKSNDGEGYYVQLSPKPEPYQIKFERNRVVKTMRPDHDGRCFRVYGGKGKERGILIHEAPNVGYVIGCISPRPLNDYTIAHPNYPGNPSYQSMNELLDFVGTGYADLFVLDW